MAVSVDASVIESCGGDGVGVGSGVGVGVGDGTGSDTTSGEALLSLPPHAENSNKLKRIQ
jgi:hypothetical protein